MSNKFELFGKLRFLPVFITQFLGAFNDNFMRYALVILISYKMAGEDAEFLINLVAILLIIPYILFSSSAGQIADKFQRIKIARFTKYLELIIVIITTYGFWTNNINLLLLSVFLLGTQSAFFSPVKYSLLPDQLKKEELIPGNAFIEAGTFLAILIGTILGTQFGSFIDITNPATTLFISVIMLTASLIGIFAAYKIPRAEIGNKDLKFNYNPLSSTLEIIKRIKTNPDLYRTILGTSWFWVLGIVFLTNFVTYAHDVVYVDPDVATIFFIIFSVGVALGSIICAKLLDGEISARYAPIALLGVSIFTFLLDGATQLAPTGYEGYLISPLEFFSGLGGIVVGFSIFAIAFCAGLYVVPLKAIVQKNAEQKARSRIIAGENIFNSLFMVAGAVASIILLSIGVGVTGLFFILAVINLGVAFFVVALMPETLMQTVLRWIFKLLYRVEVRGLENFEKAGKRVVIMPNHQSYLDAPLLSSFLPEKPNFAIDPEAAKRWFVKPLLFMYKTFKVDLSTAISVKTLSDFVEKDNKLVIFPEGRITVTGSLMKIYEGPALVAASADAMILPVYIQGAKYSYFSKMDGKIRRKLFPKITITILPPTKLESKLKSPRARRKDMSNKVDRLMSEAMFAATNYDRTIIGTILESAYTHGFGKTILEDITRNKLTYRQLFLKIIVLGGALEKVLDKDRKHIGLMLPNALACVVSFLAINYIKKTPALINFSAGIKNINSAIKTAELKQIVTSRMFIKKGELEHVIEAMDSDVEIIYLEDVAKKISPIAKITGLISSYFPATAFREVLARDGQKAAAIIFTSGSEGVPKGVVLSHININANISQADAIIDINSRDIVLNVLPMFHSFGLTVGALLPLVKGMYCFLYPSPLHYNIIPEVAYKIQATLICGTDTFFNKYAEAAHQYDFTSVRYAIAGAERLKESTYRNWSDKFGVRIMQGYGVSETAPLISVNTKRQNKFGSIGKIVPGMEWEIKKVDGIEQGGELVVSGKNVMMGYLKADKPGVLQPPKDGKHYTGDIVEFDEEEFLFIRGRAKRFSKIAGEMVSIPAVEEVLATAFPDINTVVIGVRVKEKGERLVLVSEDKKLTLEKAVEAIKAMGMPNVACPRRVHVTEIPVMGTGKTDYVTLEKMMQEMFGED